MIRVDMTGRRISKMTKEVEYLKKQLELQREVLDKLKFPINDARRAKLAGYKQAIIDLEEYHKKGDFQDE